MGIDLDCYNKLLESDLEHILVHTSDLWSSLKSSTIFITGGTGFFGKWFLETFAYANLKLGADLNVIVLSRDPDNFLKKYPHFGNNAFLKFIKGDVKNFRYPDESIDYIIHAATESSEKLNANDPLLMFDTIVNGTVNVLNLARQKNPKALLFTSSGAVYGKQPPDITHVSEDYRGGPDQTDVKSAYAEGKRAGELLCSIYNSQWNVHAKIARCFAFVGPYLPLDVHFAIGNFIRDGLNGGPITVRGDGSPFRSYLYSADLVIWLLYILNHAVDSHPYNVGSSFEIDIESLAHLVSRQFKPAPDVLVKNRRDPHRVPERYVPSVERTMRELNVRQHIDLNEAVGRTISFYQRSAAGSGK